jgi:hypothetical protein
MKAFCQIDSSTGQSSRFSPSTWPSTALANHSSSTGQIPLPEQKITSIKSSPQNALPIQCGNVSSVR